MAKGHPFDALLPSVLEEAIDFNASHTLAETAEVRTGWFKYWLNRMGALKEEEAALKASMPPERAKVLEGKNLLLWQEMLRASGYPDLGVVDLMKEGVDLAGQVPASGLFGPCFKPAKLSPAGLAQQTPEVRQKILWEYWFPSADSFTPRSCSSTLPAEYRKFLEVRTSTRKELERIRGRMLLAGGQLFGRLGRTCVKALQQAEADPQCVITDAMASAITLFIDLLKNGPPRTISNLSAQPCYIFTDAAFDRAGGSSRCGLGGVLIGPDGMPRRFFSVELHESFQRALGVDESSTIIFEAELCAVVLAYVLWRDDICSRPIVCYIDNNATRDVLISGSARNQVGARLARLLLTYGGDPGQNLQLVRTSAQSVKLSRRAFQDPHVHLSI